MGAVTRIETRSVPSTGDVVVTVVGELDLANAPELEAHLREAADRGEGTVLVDLSECQFMDSSALKVLVAARDASGGRVSLVAPHAVVKKLLELTQLDRVLKVHPDKAGALNGHIRA